jgi:hypothetical protein
MSFFSFLSSRESKVKNERLEAEISKVCEDLTNGIIELSEKAKKLNELKEKYNKSSSELQKSATSDQSSKPAEKKSFFSALFPSSEDDGTPVNPAAPPPTPNVSESLDAETNNVDNVPAPDAPDAPFDLSQESALSDASTVVPEKPLSSFESLSEAAPVSNEVLQKGSLSLPASPPALVPDSVPKSLVQQQAPGVEGDDTAKESSIIGGKNKKKSKRSKKTISNSTKKPNNSPKTKKVKYDDAKARSQGLAQAQAQAQAQGQT